MRWIVVLTGLLLVLPAGAESIVEVLHRSQQQRIEVTPLADAAGSRAETVRRSFVVVSNAIAHLPAVELRVVQGALGAETMHGRVVMASEALADLSEGERQFVLAHELGHVMQQHWGQVNALYQKWVPGDVRPQTTDPVAAPLAREASQQSHRHEHEADAFALRVLRSLGHDPNVAVAVFMRQGVTHDTATHPGTRKRLAWLRTALANEP
jgi:Zn-dependent protease with chaperone function